MEAIEDNEFIIFKCPHEECQQYIMVAKKELNCKIFRHGVRKQNFEQINPHAPKNECDTLIRSNSVYGCGCPFEIVKIAGKYYPKVCEYK